MHGPVVTVLLPSDSPADTGLLPTFSVALGDVLEDWYETSK